ncbi:MAG: NADH-quinone oxidoreductase subunit C [Methanomassiliicoccaceae archaeon]|jgi:NADH-quinone oxidoreductase subunit C|nr:NADH-quinone oxidoreductase subunit C [Methanomassiliicoccaceae archaeon]
MIAPKDFIEAPSVEHIAGDVERVFSPYVVAKRTAVRRVYFTCDREAIYDVCKYLRDALNFEHASSVCGVDWGDHLQVVYHLSNYCTGTMVEITVDVPNEDPHIASVALLWEGADWHERETYELFGIIFDGHPKLERLLTPQNYEFFPFRKSYKLRGQE